MLSICDSVDEAEGGITASLKGSFMEAVAVKASVSEIPCSRPSNPVTGPSETGECSDDDSDIRAISAWINDDSSSSFDSSDEQDTLLDDLAIWSTECKITAVACDKLLKVLHRYHPHLPLTARTLLKSQDSYSQYANCTIKEIASGHYLHLGILNGLLPYAEQVIKNKQTRFQYQVNIDGLPLFNSSPMQLWPILGRLLEVDPRPPVFVIGVFCGNSKPGKINEFLTDFLEEAQVLTNKGFTLPGIDDVFKAEISCFICDAPARAYVKNIKSHSGYHSCERCEQRGEYIDGKVTFPETQSSKRTDELFRALWYDDHQIDRSPLENLGVGLVTGMVLDSMHLVYLGVVRRLLNCWKTGKGVQEPKATKISSRQVDVISGKLVNLRHHIPREFARKPRSLFELDRWKASELRQFLLYTGLIVLKSEISDKFYENFRCLSIAIFLLSSERLCKHYCGYAEELLIFFVEQCIELYGPAFVVYNVHGLIHLADDVRNFGHLESISSFPFENFLGHMKKCVRKPQQVLQQIQKRVLQGYFSQSALNKVQKYPVVKQEHQNGPLLAGVANCKQYKEVQLTEYILNINTGNNCICYHDSRIALIRNVCSDGHLVFLIVQLFCKKDSAFLSPLNSADIGIFILSDLSRELHIVPVANVTCKYVLLPHESTGKQWIGIPLLHTV
jgi:hypothetical protein